MQSAHPNLYIGAPRGKGCSKTISVITSKIRRLSKKCGGRLLDIGCGDGSFTTMLSDDFNEVHGIQIGQWKKAGRIPLLLYIPWLHKRFAQARVFTVRQLDRLFIPNGLKRVAVDYAWPTFEHGGNALQPFIKHFFRLMRVLEESPVRLFGSSVIVKYIREPRFNESEEMRS